MRPGSGVRASFATLCGVLACGWALGATLKTSKGEVVEGAVQGLLVLEGRTSSDDGGELLTYFLFNGADLRTAAAGRVELTSGAVLLQCMCLSETTSAPQVLERILSRPPTTGFRLDRPGEGDGLRLTRHQEPDMVNAWPFPGAGGSVFCTFGSARAGGLAGGLRGELRSSGGAEKKARLVPSLSLERPGSVVSVPVGDLGS